MKAPRIGGLLAIALIALAVVAAPALATPNTTGSGATAPFWTPIGNTTDSSFTADTTRLNFSAVSGDGVTSFDLTCMATFDAYVPQTHTRALITSFIPGPCTSPTFPTADVFWIIPATSETPYALHLTQRVAANSWRGTLSTSPNADMTIWVIDNAMTICRFSFPAQSFRFVDTDANTSIALNDSTATFRNDATPASMSCPDPARTGTIGSTFTFSSDTDGDNLRSTPASD